MRVLIEVRPELPVPPYEQIRRQIAAAIFGGEVAAGEKLPTVRDVSATMGVAQGTVARAYRELESAGLIISRRGAGTFVNSPLAGAVHGDVRRLIEEVASRVVEYGVSAETASMLLARAFQQIEHDRRASGSGSGSGS